jgi:hypothetical protein
MKKLYQGIVKSAMGDYASAYLPTLLMFHGATPEQFSRLHLVEQPHLLRQLLVNYNEKKLKYPLRNYLHRHPKADGSQLFHYATRVLNCEPAQFQERLKRIATDVVDRAHLYTEDGVVKSQVAGYFSYDTYEQWKAELELFNSWECPKCGTSETVHIDDNEGSEFEHVSGPYHRCGHCDSVVRPIVEPAESIDGRDVGTGEEWDDYKSHLSELVEQLGNHLEAAGLPAPSGLRIDIGNADWRGRDAYAECAFDGEELADKVSVNSPFTISNGKLWLQQIGLGRLTCALSHHDVPMGSSVEIQPSWECELDGEPLIGEQIFDCVELAKAATHLFAGPEFCFEFSPGTQMRAVSEDGFTESVAYLCRQLGLEEDDPIRMLLETLDRDGRYLVTQAEAIRKLIDVRLAEEQEEAA